MLSLVLRRLLAPGSRHTSGSTLVFSGLAGEPDSLNPLLSNESDELNFSHLYMSYLIENDNRRNEIPEIALQVPTLENGGISSDQRTVTYHLRQDFAGKTAYHLRRATSSFRIARS